MNATAPRPLFDYFRIDSRKATDGVWVTHPESGDRFRLRRRFGPQHGEAYRAAHLEYEGKHGPEAAKTPEADQAIDAVAMAAGVVVDWQLANAPDRPYDRAAMAAAFADPALAELRHWITRQADTRAHFRPDDPKETP